MGAIKKIAIGSAILAAIGGGIAYVTRLNRVSKELVVVPKVIIHKLAFDGITLRVDARLKNPTRTRLKLKFPFVKLMYRDTVIGSSQMVNKDIIIPAYGEASVDKMMVTIPLLGIFSVVGDLLKSLTDGSAVMLKVKTMSTIDLGWRKQPYEDVKEVSLRKEQPVQESGQSESTETTTA